MSLLLEPGHIVRNKDRPDWGLGQVQSVTGNRATINFEHLGKIVADSSTVPLEVVDEDDF